MLPVGGLTAANEFDGAGNDLDELFKIGAHALHDFNLILRQEL